MAEIPAASTLRIVAGHPTPEQAAAVTVVLAALAGTALAGTALAGTALAGTAAAGTQPGPDAPRSEWSDRSRLLRPAVSAGPGAWRASARPA